jgi:hypothetical protein
MQLNLVARAGAQPRKSLSPRFMVETIPDA